MWMNINLSAVSVLCKRSKLLILDKVLELRKSVLEGLDWLGRAGLRQPLVLVRTLFQKLDGSEAEVFQVRFKRGENGYKTGREVNILTANETVTGFLRIRPRALITSFVLAFRVLFGLRIGVVVNLHQKGAVA